MTALYREGNQESQCILRSVCIQNIMRLRWPSACRTRTAYEYGNATRAHVELI
jgi:hypothetical protein